MTRVHRVPELVAHAAAELFGRSVSGLFFKDRSNSHAAHAGRTSNCTLRETFKMQVLDGGAFVGTFLVQGIECAIGVAVFTMEFLLAAGSTTIFAQIDRAAAATGDRNHTSFHSLFENLLASYHTSVAIRPLPKPGIGPDTPAVAVDDPLDQRQAHAGALALLGAV